MKRLYFGFGLLILMLVTGIVITARFSALHAPLAQQLRQAQNAAEAGSWEQARALTEDARTQWENSRHFTAAVADHEPMEQMDSLFARLTVLARLENAEAFAADCAELARLATSMAHSQQLFWWNLL